MALFPLAPVRPPRAVLRRVDLARRPRTWLAGLQSAQSELLLTAWRKAAMAQGWTFSDDWATRETAVVVRALVRGGHGTALSDRLESLGAARAGAGVGLLDALRDLLALETVVGSRVLPREAVIDVARGWSRGSEQLAPIAADPDTGLGTRAYLDMRLREAYEAADYQGTSASQQWSLVVLDVVMDPPDTSDVAGMVGMMSPVLPMAVADLLRMVFNAGQPLVRLTDDRYAALVPQDGPVLEQAEILAEMVSERLHRLDPAAPEISVRWHVIDLPHEQQGIQEALGRLAG